MTDQSSRFGIKLGTKLMLLIGAALASMIIISAVAVVGLNRIAEDSRNLYEKGFTELSFIGKLQVQIEQLDGLAAKAPKETDLRALADGKKQFLAVANKLRADLLEAQKMAVDEGSRQADEITSIITALTDFVQHSIHVYRMMEDGDWYGADKMLKGESVAAKKRLDDLASDYIGKVNVKARGFVGNMKASIRLMTTAAVVAALFLVMLVGGWGFYVIAKGMRAINAITGVTGRLAAGDMGVRIPGGERADEIGEMARSLEQIRAVGIRAARAQSSLDDASSPMMIVDPDGMVIFPNKAMVELAGGLAGDLAAELSGFAMPSLSGIRFDTLHNIETFCADHLKALEEKASARMVVVGRTIDMTASPVFNEAGGRLGTVIEWRDRTGQVAVEREIAGIVHAASEGDFSQRLTEADKSGFMADLSSGINELLDVVDGGLRQVVKIMSALAEGDLTKRMKGEHRGAFARLQEDADRMGRTMEEIIGRIAEVSGAVQTATDEISSGIADLSVRTEHQASSLEETTASMEELSATVRQNSDNAQEANHIAAAAREAAVTGGHVAENAIAAMSGIETSSKQITEIVGLIQEIAFQTNLLALNASVEAARAGEAGRGFAVVANEVRALAQRAASASKDIRELIVNSDNRVQEGAKLVNEAGSALEEIVTSVKKVADFVSEIAAASHQQTSGIEQVSGAITGMDEMTQQNATLVEETTGAIESAVGQVADLQAAVGFFRTSQSAPVNAPRAADADADDSSRLRTVVRRMGAGRNERQTAAATAEPDQDGWEAF